MRRLERRGALLSPRRDRGLGPAVLVPDPGHGADPDARGAEPSASLNATMPESAYDCIVIGSGPGGYVAAIRAAQLGMKHRRGREGRGRRPLPQLRVHPRQGRPARRGRAVTRSTTRPSSASRCPDRTVDFGDGRRAPREGRQDADRRRLRPVQEEQDRLHRGRRRLAGDGQRVRSTARSIEARKAIVLATGSVPKPIPGTEFGGRVIGTEGRGRSRSCRRRSPSSARARRARRSPPPTAASAPTCCCSRRSTACSRPRTPTSPRSPDARSPSRT